MLHAITTLDVRSLAEWQLEAAVSVWRDFADREFRSFHECTLDASRIELDERLVPEVLGLSEAKDTLRQLRQLLADEPSIHGTKSTVVLVAG